MATRFFTRSLLTTKQTLSSAFSRSYTSLSLSTSHSSLSTSILRVRPLVAVAAHFHRLSPAATSIRGFATRQTSSSLNDSNPNWSNRPPKETILLEGCDFEHWLVVVEKPEGEPTRDEIIDSYIKTLATVVGSEEEARMKIYSVSTRHYFAFGALVSEETSYKLKELPHVRWVLPDSYLDVRNKDYGGEPFINGQAVPYDPKYHEEWVRNNARANDRNRRNDRPRNYDRSRNFERRRENMQNRGFQANQNVQNPGSNMGGPPGNMANNMPPNNMGGPPGNVANNMPPNNMGGPPGNMANNMPPNNMGGPPNNMGGPPNMQQNNTGRMGTPQNNMGMQPNNMGGQPYPPNNMGVPNNAPNFQYQGGPNNNGMPYQNREMTGPGHNREYQHNYAPPPNQPRGNPYQTENIPGRDMPPPPNYHQ